LDKAMARLEQAAERLKPQLPLIAAQPQLEKRLADSRRHNDILREAVGRVATRLDHVIGRLQAGLK
jgi:hypothetical protein